MVILSFTIKDMRDEVEHLESLGKAQTAVVRFFLTKTTETKITETKKINLNTKDMVLIPDTKLQS